MKFITITFTNGLKGHLNISNANYFYRESTRDYTCIEFPSGGEVLVMETPEQILHKLLGNNP